MSNCIKCKAELPEGAAFCPACGKKQTADQRKHKKRANGTGNISKLSGSRSKPWLARKNGILIGTYATRAEAQKALERVTDDIINDKYHLTFSQVFQRWKAEHQREITEKTMRDYEWAYNNCPQLHDRPIRSILRSDYQAAIILLEQKGMSKSSCQRLRLVIGMLAKWAMEEGITNKNPAENLTTTAKQKSQRQIFLEGQISDIKKAQHPAAQIALILIACGCRPGELFTVPLVNCHDSYFIGGSKTEAGKNRVIPIGPDGLAAYRKLRQDAMDNGGSLLIDGYNGNRTAANFAKKGRDWDQLMQEIGCPGMVPYSCRHTFITRAIRSGIDLPKLEAIVGHVDRETTRIYTHLQAEDLVESVQNMESKPFAVCNKSATNPKPQNSNCVKKLG